MFKANDDTKENIEVLTAFLTSSPDGSTLSWVEIEQGTGVQMSTVGRSLVRRVLHKIKREYYPLRGSGIRISDKSNAIAIVRIRDSRIVGAAKRANKAGTRIQSRHLEELTPGDRAEFLLRSSLRGAILSGSRGLKQIASSREVPPPPMLPR